MNNEQRAAELLAFYFSRAVGRENWEIDNDAEIKDLVESIIRAAVARIPEAIPATLDSVEGHPNYLPILARIADALETIAGGVSNVAL